MTAFPFLLGCSVVSTGLILDPIVTTTVGTNNGYVDGVDADGLPLVESGEAVSTTAWTGLFVADPGDQSADQVGSVALLDLPSTADPAAITRWTWSTTEAGAACGRALATVELTATIGCPEAAVAGTERAGTVLHWELPESPEPAGAINGTVAGGLFGSSLALLGGTSGQELLLAGAPGEDGAAHLGGAVYLLGLEADTASEALADVQGAEDYLNLGEALGPQIDLEADGQAEALLPARRQVWGLDLDLRGRARLSDLWGPWRAPGTGSSVQAASADTDGDGYAEVLLLDREFDVLLGWSVLAADPEFTMELSPGLALPNYLHGIGDLNRDGSHEIYFSDGRSGGFVVFGRAWSGHVALEPGVDLDAGSRARVVRNVGDWNADGADDLFIAEDPVMGVYSGGELLWWAP